jgi:uncharacterized metal-binding protein
MCQETGVLIFPCSGSSDVGELSDRVARKIAKCGKAKMFCLAGIGAHIPGMIEFTKAAKRIIAINGCPVSCATKTLEHAGFKVESYNLKDLGLEKGKTKVDEDSINIVVSKITEEKNRNIKGE